jgi:hypothetical protein
MSTVSIPVDAHLITLLVRSSRIATRRIEAGRTTQTRRERVQTVEEVSPGWTRRDLQQAMSGANQIWSQAQIAFTLRCVRPERVAAPGNRAVVNPNGFQFLISQFPARSGISLLLVYRFSGNEVGVQASRGVAILPFLSRNMRARILAHEFGHLLGVDHMEATRTHLENLMRPGLVAGNQLTQDQINTARRSSLVTQATQSQPTP